jgi:hypothetical protein
MIPYAAMVKVHERDKFVCPYCGVDGTKSFDTWLSFSRDHLLPTGCDDREKDEYIVTACQFCNTADNQYFVKAEKEGYSFDDKTPEELIEQRWKAVQKTRQEYKEFWVERISIHAK